MTSVQERTEPNPTLPQHLLLVTCDSHIGPTMDQLRPYCEQRYLEQFDAFAAHVAKTAAHADRSSDHNQAVVERVHSAGAQDHEGRLRDLDGDGVAAEVIFHGAQNGQPLPLTTDLSFHVVAEDPELAKVGLRIYNRWLADFCSMAPDRRCGLVQIPVWDPEACRGEVEWAREAGLRGVNFPVVRLHEHNIPLYPDPVWEPFFSACESLELPLVSHGSGLDSNRYHGFGRRAMHLAYGAVNTRQTAWWLIFTGILERHPGLRYVLTEVTGDWLVSDLRYMDSVYNADALSDLRDIVHKSPTEYFRTQIYLGASMMSNYEAHRFLDELGLVDTVMWGSDYPHIEGTWPLTKLSVRKTFHDFPARIVKKVCADNAIELYGFDADKLQPIADQIGPTYSEVAEPLDAVPDGLGYSLAFRGDGAFT